jgi:hypothetical protein
MRWVRITGALIAVVAVTGIVDIAHAQDGVFIDPGSPSGKEYEIPFESARRGAVPETDPSAPITQGERSAVPFGEGISGDTSSGGVEGARSTSRSEEAATSRDGRGGSRSGDESAIRIVEAASNNPGAPPASTGSTLLYLGVGAVALALGAGIGVFLRRRRA